MDAKVQGTLEDQETLEELMPNGKPKILKLTVVAGTEDPRVATVTIGFGNRHVTKQAASSKGPYDAIAKAIGKIVPNSAVLVGCKLKTHGDGTDAIGQQTVIIRLEGRIYRATSRSIDTTLAFARAYLGALKQTRLMCG